jgi:hypothetical protein
VCREIEQFEAQLEVIRKFEKDKDAIAQDILVKETNIEEEKRKHEKEKETTRKTTQDLLERSAKQNEEQLEREKEEYYDHLLRTTDQAILLHIQRRNNYENDMMSLRDMYDDYSEKIKARRDGNAKLHETIEQLKSAELINRSADQRQQICNLRRELAASREQLRQLQDKTKRDRDTAEQQRQDEANKMELTLKLQQDQLDHKLQQIAALRELTLRVLSYRSQLEAEFITVLGEMIYEVAQRENPGQRPLQTKTTRKLALSTTASSTSQTPTVAVRNKDFSVTHVLAKFTVEDRGSVLQRFMDRVHGEVEKNERMLSPLSSEDGEETAKPTSV